MIFHIHVGKTIHGVRAKVLSNAGGGKGGGGGGGGDGHCRWELIFNVEASK